MDITTTPDNPPQFRALERELANLGRDMRFKARAHQSALRPLECDLPPNQVFELVQAAAIEMSRWEIAAVEASRFQLEAVVSARLPLLFKSDVVIQVRPSGDGKSLVHVRAKARRSGEWRRGGAELRRIRAFLRRLGAKLE